MRKALRFDFVRFCLVGALGFILNFLLLTLFFRILDWPILLAQLLASEISLFSNFLLHDRWTYKRNNVTKSLRRLIIEFHATSWMAVIGSSLLITFGVHVLDLNYVVALAISSAIVLMWNFTWTKFYVWRHEKNDKGDTE